MSKDIYVFVEQRDGEVVNVGLELIGEATRLAKELNQKVIAVLLGNEIKQKCLGLIQYGADEVIYVDSPMLKEYLTEPYTKAITQLIEEYTPEIFLYGATSIGRDLAPRVAARIYTGLTADCTGLSIDPETKLLLMTRPAFGGNIMATIVCKERRPQMATVRQGVMEALVKDESRDGVLKQMVVDFEQNDTDIEIIEVVNEKRSVADITEAKIIVAGGRGIGKSEMFNTLKELAHELGGNIASSRANVDEGWIDKDYQVGQTGKTVKPDLYIACGISGAIQHVIGMESSDYIISINKDEEAPIFDISDLGIVGDVQIILPKLIEAIKSRKAEKAAI